MWRAVSCCCRLSSVVSAGWQLHSRRLRLCGELPEGLSPTLSHMRVVREATARLDDLANRFGGGEVEGGQREGTFGSVCVCQGWEEVMSRAMCAAEGEGWCGCLWHCRLYTHCMWRLG